MLKAVSPFLNMKKRKRRATWILTFVFVPQSYIFPAVWECVSHAQKKGHFLLAKRNAELPLLSSAKYYGAFHRPFLQTKLDILGIFVCSLPLCLLFCFGTLCRQFIPYAVINLDEASSLVYGVVLRVSILCSPITYDSVSAKAQKKKIINENHQTMAQVALGTALHIHRTTRAPVDVVPDSFCPYSWILSTIPDGSIVSSP